MELFQLKETKFVIKDIKMNTRKLTKVFFNAKQQSWKKSKFCSWGPTRFSTLYKGVEAWTIYVVNFIPRVVHWQNSILHKMLYQHPSILYFTYLVTGLWNSIHLQQGTISFMFGNKIWIQEHSFWNHAKSIMASGIKLTGTHPDRKLRLSGLGSLVYKPHNPGYSVAYYRQLNRELGLLNILNKEAGFRVYSWIRRDLVDLREQSALQESSVHKISWLRRL